MGRLDVSMLEHALAYAAAGWPVFPCSPNNKRPLLPAESAPGLKDGGYHLASTDAAKIRAWWGKWPQAMIGVPTGGRSVGSDGQAIGTAAWVLDLDARKMDTDVAGLRALVEEAIGGQLPEGPVTATPGGQHLWLALPEGADVGNRANVIAKGIDVRGDGTGYVIVPPSVRRGAQAVKDGCDGVAYRWLIAPEGLGAWDPETGEELPGLPVPAAPDALVRVVCKLDQSASAGATFPLPSGTAEAGRSPRAPGGAERAGDDPREAARRKFALSALDLELGQLAAAGKGARGDTLNRVGFALGQIVGAGYLSRAAIEAGLWSALATNGLVVTDGQKRCADTIRRSVEDGMREPRDMSGVGRMAGTGRPRREEPPPPSSADAAPAPPGGGPDRGSRGSRDGSVPAGGGAGGEPPSDIGNTVSGEQPDPAAVAELVDEPQNDTGNGRRLLKHFGRRMLHVRDVGTHVWAGTHWELQGGAETVLCFAQKTAEWIAEEAWHIFPSRRDAELIEAAERLAALPKDDQTPEDKQLLAEATAAADRLGKRRDARRKFAISSGNASKVRAMIDMAEPHCTVAPDALDVDPYAINLLTGTLRLVPVDTMEYDPDAPAEQPRKIRVRRWRVQEDGHDPEDRLSKVMPVAYDPKAACPKFMAFLEMVQPKPALRDYLRRSYGYGLLGLTAVQAFWFHYGHGANGKSTFMEVMARIQGPYGRVLPAEALTGEGQRRSDQATPEFARLPGARMVRCAELPRGQSFKESTLKMLTGGETILVRHLNEGFFEFRPIFKVTGSGNDKPSIGGVDEGIWRRMKLVPWEVTIPEDQRRDMEEVLAEFAAEAPGILNWLLAGALDYLHEGMTVPAEVRAATETYRNEQDPVGDFLRVCVAPMPAAEVQARRLFDTFTAWCRENSVKPYGEKAFAEIMSKKGYEKKRTRIRMYSDIMIVYSPGADDEQGQYPSSYGGGG